jgi:hypothetical protein
MERVKIAKIRAATVAALAAKGTKGWRTASEDAIAMLIEWAERMEPRLGRLEIARAAETVDGARLRWEWRRIPGESDESGSASGRSIALARSTGAGE